MDDFCWSVFWEFWQNLPVIVLFVVAVWLWAQGNRAKAIGCAVAGAVIGSLVIRFTEVMADGSREPVSVTLTNVVVLSVMQTLFMMYLGVEKEWSNWKTDVMLGGVAGVLMAITQALAASGAMLVGVILHSVALAMGGALVLIGVRKLKGQSLIRAALYSVLMTVTMTLVISLLDYSYRLLT
jgi:hypothetical protein